LNTRKHSQFSTILALIPPVEARRCGLFVMSRALTQRLSLQHFIWQFINAVTRTIRDPGKSQSECVSRQKISRADHLSGDSGARGVFLCIADASFPVKCPLERTIGSWHSVMGRIRWDTQARVARVKQLLRLDWDIVAGITAAVLAIVLHLLHVVDVDVLLTIALVLLAVLLFRDLRREWHDDYVAETIEQVKAGLQDVQHSVNLPEATLIGPRSLRAESRRFAETARGEMIWFNVCFMMFRTQEVFDLLLRPAIENPLVESIRFISSESEKDLWEQHMLPRIRACSGSDKVSSPRWRQLPQTVSFILAEFEPRGDDTKRSTEALLSFWGDPFMSQVIGRQAPRYIFRVHGHSDLVTQFIEMERQHRMSDG